MTSRSRRRLAGANGLSLYRFNHAARVLLMVTTRASLRLLLCASILISPSLRFTLSHFKRWASVGRSPPNKQTAMYGATRPRRCDAALESNFWHSLTLRIATSLPSLLHSISTPLHGLI